MLVVTTRAGPRPRSVTTWALDHDIELGHFSVSQPTLEDIYLELTGGPTSTMPKFRRLSR